ncbi:hypothetical protein DFA_01984 [Cavenderia fasciculata]|uniref:MRH domain-containing protein n=1 Tax=Cavenderia fasciculata TaxID=261658 RepID=F4PR37_CACFS|nr:uncharacterized protein DFA_01984 [Cavenderia fasciculata]EGG22094.1 hypothetical protein DFA_01984 [Cavenderia fasciculata]|eukprot:XP_004359945.1 hypothetical protein DFA_01984 [Cavenderia fasciculata]
MIDCHHVLAFPFLGIEQVVPSKGKIGVVKTIEIKGRAFGDDISNIVVNLVGAGQCIVQSVFDDRSITCTLPVYLSNRRFRVTVEVNGTMTSDPAYYRYYGRLTCRGLSDQQQDPITTGSNFQKQVDWWYIYWVANQQQPNDNDNENDGGRYIYSDSLNIQPSWKSNLIRKLPISNNGGNNNNVIIIGDFIVSPLAATFLQYRDYNYLAYNDIQGHRDEQSGEQTVTYPLDGLEGQGKGLFMWDESTMHGIHIIHSVPAFPAIATPPRLKQKASRWLELNNKSKSKTITQTETEELKNIYDEFYQQVKGSSGNFNLTFLDPFTQAKTTDSDDDDSEYLIDDSINADDSHGWLGGNSNNNHNFFCREFDNYQVALKYYAQTNAALYSYRLINNNSNIDDFNNRNNQNSFIDNLNSLKSNYLNECSSFLNNNNSNSKCDWIDDSIKIKGLSNTVLFTKTSITASLKYLNQQSRFKDNNNNEDDDQNNNENNENSTPPSTTTTQGRYPSILKNSNNNNNKSNSNNNSKPRMITKYITRSGKKDNTVVFSSATNNKNVGVDIWERVVELYDQPMFVEGCTVSQSSNHFYNPQNLKLDPKNSIQAKLSNVEYLSYFDKEGLINSKGRINLYSKQAYSMYPIKSSGFDISIFCVGDLNRNIGQEKKGGGILCFKNDHLSFYFNRMVSYYSTSQDEDETTLLPWSIPFSQPLEILNSLGQPINNSSSIGVSFEILEIFPQTFNIPIRYQNNNNNNNNKNNSVSFKKRENYNNGVRTKLLKQFVQISSSQSSFTSKSIRNREESQDGIGFSSRYMFTDKRLYSLLYTAASITDNIYCCIYQLDSYSRPIACTLDNSIQLNNLNQQQIKNNNNNNNIDFPPLNLKQPSSTFSSPSIVSRPIDRLKFVDDGWIEFQHDIMVAKKFKNIIQQFTTTSDNSPLSIIFTDWIDKPIQIKYDIDGRNPSNSRSTFDQTSIIYSNSQQCSIELIYLQTLQLIVSQSPTAYSSYQNSNNTKTLFNALSLSISMKIFNEIENKLNNTIIPKCFNAIEFPKDYNLDVENINIFNNQMISLIGAFWDLMDLNNDVGYGRPGFSDENQGSMAFNWIQLLNLVFSLAADNNNELSINNYFNNLLDPLSSTSTMQNLNILYYNLVITPPEIQQQQQSKNISKNSRERELSPLPNDIIESFNTNNLGQEVIDRIMKSLDMWITINENNQAIQILLNNPQQQQSSQLLEYLEDIYHEIRSDDITLCYKYSNHNNTISNNSSYIVDLCNNPLSIVSITNLIVMAINSINSIQLNKNINGGVDLFYLPSPSTLKTNNFGLLITLVNNSICDVALVNNKLLLDNILNITKINSTSVEGKVEKIIIDNGLCKNIGPTISNIQQVSGLTTGGYQITMIGFYFTEYNVAMIGEKECLQTMFISNTKLICIVPPNIGKSHQIKIKDQSSQSNFFFNYNDTIIYNVGPKLIDNNNLCSIQSITHTQIICKMNLIGGAVGRNRLVRVFIGDTLSTYQNDDINESMISYSPPTIQRVLNGTSSSSVSIWSKTDREVITIIGLRFGTNLSPPLVNIGDYRCFVLEYNTTTIQCRVPPSNSFGPFPLLVQVDGQLSNRIPFYFAAAEIQYLSSTRIPTVGQFIHLYGSGLGMTSESINYIRINQSIDITDQCSQFATFIECLLPKGIGANLRLDLSVRDQKTIGITPIFSYNPPLIKSISIDSTLKRVTIIGSDFIPSQVSYLLKSVMVIFNNSPLSSSSSSSYLNETTIITQLNENSIDIDYISSVKVMIGYLYSNLYNLNPNYGDYGCSGFMKYGNQNISVTNGEYNPHQYGWCKGITNNTQCLATLQFNLPNDCTASTTKEDGLILISFKYTVNLNLVIDSEIINSIGGVGSKTRLPPPVPLSFAQLSSVIVLVKTNYNGKQETRKLKLSNYRQSIDCPLSCLVVIQSSDKSLIPIFNNIPFNFQPPQTTSLEMNVGFFTLDRFSGPVSMSLQSHFKSLFTITLPIGRFTFSTSVQTKSFASGPITAIVSATTPPDQLVNIFEQTNLNNPLYIINNSTRNINPTRKATTSSSSSSSSTTWIIEIAATDLFNDYPSFSRFGQNIIIRNDYDINNPPQLYIDRVTKLVCTNILPLSTRKRSCQFPRLASPPPKNIRNIITLEQSSTWLANTYPFNYSKIVVSGYVFNDLNRNFIREGQESGLGGITINAIYYGTQFKTKSQLDGKYSLDIDDSNISVSGPGPIVLSLFDKPSSLSTYFTPYSWTPSVTIQPPTVTYPNTNIPMIDRSSYPSCIYNGLDFTSMSLITFEKTIKSIEEKNVSINGRIQKQQVSQEYKYEWNVCGVCDTCTYKVKNSSNYGLSVCQTSLSKVGSPVVHLGETVFSTWSPNVANNTGATLTIKTTKPVCPGGKPRTTRIHLACGSTIATVWIKESSPCEYDIYMITPSACSNPKCRYQGIDFTPLSRVDYQIVSKIGYETKTLIFSICGTSNQCIQKLGDQYINNNNNNNNGISINDMASCMLVTNNNSNNNLSSYNYNRWILVANNSNSQWVSNYGGSIALIYKNTNPSTLTTKTTNPANASKNQPLPLQCSPNEPILSIIFYCATGTNQTSVTSLEQSSPCSYTVRMNTPLVCNQ